MAARVFLVQFLFISRHVVVPSSALKEQPPPPSIISAIDSASSTNDENYIFRKCCPKNTAFVNASKAQCLNHPKAGLPDVLTHYIGELQDHEHSLIMGDGITLCPTGKEPIVYSMPEFRFLGNGSSVYIEDLKTALAYEDFCLEYFFNQSGVPVPGLLGCFSRDMSDALRLSSGMIISMPFLLITFLVYAVLPDRNLHQTALMFYVLSLLLSYVMLVTINLSESLQAPTCEILAYSTLFFFMVSFFWMNVICFDIWYTFSGARGYVGSSKRTSERRKILLYSIYAFGVPLLVVVMVFVLQKVLPADSVHNPGIGTSKCFIADGWPNLWYFYGEAGIMVLANIVFFMMTALKIRQIKKETSMLKHTDNKRHNYEKDKQKFNLYVKLLFAMGVNWSMEVISWLVNWNTSYKVQYIWYATDFFNAVYGVFIFFIFVFKKKMWKLLQKRYYNFIGKPHLAHTMTSTNTRTSHYSSSVADTTLTDGTHAANGRARLEEVALKNVT